MKIKLLFIAILLSTNGFSQSNIDRIKKFLNNNSKSRLVNSEVDNLIITDEFITTSGITVCHVKQTHNGVPLLNNQTVFLINPDNKVTLSDQINFEENLSKKIKKQTPIVDVKTALSNALSSTDDKIETFNYSQSENDKNRIDITSNSNFKITTQIGYYQKTDKEIKLSYFFEYYSKVGDRDLWNIIVDAETGNIIDKINATIKCSFHREHDHSLNTNSVLFEKKKTFLESGIQNTVLTPGNTNYKVVPWNYESPNHYKAAFPNAADGRTTVSNPESTLALAPLTVAASPNGWHNNNATIGSSTNSTKFDYTRGNNVFAYSDLTNSNPTNITTYTNASSGTYPSLTFDYPYVGLTDIAFNNLESATTNLFYMNNIMHDLWYQYGFDEANKNFQDKNYGRGGSQGDYVLAEAQDNSESGTPRFNNANFSTPADGSNPRMQMYLWEHIAPVKIQITSGSLNGTTFEAVDNTFTAGHVELPIKPTNMTGEIVLYTDNNSDGTSIDPNDACSPSINTLTDKIVLIKRGGCNFTSKVIAAQNAGAKAVIITNNTTGEWALGGGDAAVTIPAIGISKADGDALISALSNGTINTTLINTNSNIYADGDFDNGIIAHEYGHGISTRLAGGQTCMDSSEQMGEGWSDWFWLMMQIKAGDKGTDARGIGTFASNQPTNGKGIRRYPYTTDMNVNPQTYAELSTMWYTDTTVTPSVERINVHAVGSIWATILWDLTWAYIGKYGYSSNIYNGNGGNNKVMRIVLDAIKIDGCDPSFITGRDAILAADQAITGGVDYELIWRVFARRGVGYSANSGISNTGVQGIKDNPTTLYTDLPPTLSNEEFVNPNSINIYPNPTNGYLNISFDKNITNSKISIIDLNGRVVYSEYTETISGVKTIDLNKIQSGIYICNIKGENINYTKKIILN